MRHKGENFEWAGRILSQHKERKNKEVKTLVQPPLLGSFYFFPLKEKRRGCPHKKIMLCNF